MEIAYLQNNHIRIKGKTTTLLVVPQTDDQLTKTVEAHAVLSLAFKPVTVTEEVVVVNPKIQEAKLLIQSPGEFEIGGVKITGIRNKDFIIYSMSVDGVALLVSTTAGLEGFDKKRECNIALLQATQQIQESGVKTLTDLSTNMVVLYGENGQNSATVLGASTVTTAPKVTTTIDKLPQELEVVVLS